MPFLEDKNARSLVNELSRTVNGFEPLKLWHTHITVIICFTVFIIVPGENRFLSIRHQYGGNIAIVANGRTLDPSRAHAKLNGVRGYIKIRLPDSFFEGITSVTEAQALGECIYFF